MGLLGDMFHDPMQQRHQDWLFKHHVLKSDQDDRDRRRSAERAATERTRAAERANAETARKHADQEKLWYAGDRTVYVDGNNSSDKPIPVRHFAAPLPVAYMTHPESPDPSVVFGPHFQRTRNGNLQSDDAWRAQARETLAIWEPMENRYAPVLSKLRDDEWWRNVTEAAGLCHRVTETEAWQGKYASGTRKLHTVSVPTIGRVDIAEDGLRITIELNVAVPPKKWSASLDTLRAGFKSAGMSAQNLEIHETHSGAPMLCFADLDPFDTMENVTQEFDAENGRSLLGITSRGKPAWITWKGSSGMVIGGVPGSGKTASLLGVFAAMAGKADLYVFDGKSGFDLHPLRHIATVYDNSGDLSAPLDVLKELDQLRVKRAAELHDKLGANNFWNVGLADRERLGISPIFLILDEVQTWLDTSGMSGDEKTVAGEITRLIRTLIQKARSAGIVTILTTQKPDSKTIPTVIRDNAALKLCFRVSTSEQAVTVLGKQPDGAPDPVSIPMSKKGRFVMETEGHGIVLGQAGYRDPEDIDRELAALKPQKKAQEPVQPTDTSAPTPVATPVDSPFAHIIPTPEEARQMTPEQRLEMMRLIAQLQGHVVEDAQPAEVKKPATPAPKKPAADEDDGW